MIRTASLAIALTIAATAALADTTWSATGPYGGSRSGSVDCAGRICTGSATATGPYGASRTVTGTRAVVPAPVVVRPVPRPYGVTVTRRVVVR